MWFSTSTSTRLMDPTKPRSSSSPAVFDTRRFATWNRRPSSPHSPTAA
jgi:hypothetical protein